MYIQKKQGALTSNEGSVWRNILVCQSAPVSCTETLWHAITNFEFFPPLIVICCQHLGGRNHHGTTTHPIHHDARLVYHGLPHITHLICDNTAVAGKNPAPIDMVNIPLFMSFIHPRRGRISSINSIKHSKYKLFHGTVHSYSLYATSNAETPSVRPTRETILTWPCISIPKLCFR